MDVLLPCVGLALSVNGLHATPVLVLMPGEHASCILCCSRSQPARQQAGFGTHLNRPRALNSHPTPVAWEYQLNGLIPNFCCAALSSRPLQTSLAQGALPQPSLGWTGCG